METSGAAATLARLGSRGRPPVWRRFSNLRVHGTFLSRVPIGRATVLPPSPITCPHGARTGRPTGKRATRDWKVPCTRRQESRRYDSRINSPMNRAKSSLIVVNRETSNRALYRLSKARCSHQAARCLGLLRLRRLRLCGGHGRRPPPRLGTGHPTRFLNEADAARPHPFRQSPAHGVYPSTPARNRRSLVRGPWS